MDENQVVAELRRLHEKLDTALEQIHTHKTDIAWLKKGFFATLGLLGTWIASHLYVRTGG